MARFLSSRYILYFYSSRPYFFLFLILPFSRYFFARISLILAAASFNAASALASPVRAF